MYTERRKADREKMASLIESLCAEFGASTSRDTSRPNRIALHIESGDAYVGIDFDGKTCQPDVHVFCWNTKLDSRKRFSEDMAVATDGSVNQYHRQKCQVVARGFTALGSSLRGALLALRDGWAWEDEQKAEAA